MTQGPENSTSKPNNNHTSTRASLANTLGTGVAVGTAIGLALNNLPLGIAIGVAIYGAGEYAHRRRNGTNNS